MKLQGAISESKFRVQKQVIASSKKIKQEIDYRLRASQNLGQG